MSSNTANQPFHTTMSKDMIVLIDSSWSNGCWEHNFYVSVLSVGFDSVFLIK